MQGRWVVISHSELFFFRSHCHESITSYLRRNQWLGVPFHFFSDPDMTPILQKTCCCIPNSIPIVFQPSSRHVNWHLISFLARNPSCFGCFGFHFEGPKVPRGIRESPRLPCCYSRRLSWRAAKVIERGSRQKWRSANYLKILRELRLTYDI